MVGREEQDSIDAERSLSKFGTARLQIPAVHRLFIPASAFQLPELSSAAAQCLSFPTQQYCSHICDNRESTRVRPCLRLCIPFPAHLQPLLILATGFYRNRPTGAYTFPLDLSQMSVRCSLQT